MGQTLPYLGIYVPAPGETLFGASFLAGMINVDQHDHSGGPNKGVPITGSGLANFSVTFEKLNANVVDPTTGVGVKGSPFQNQLQMLGILKNFYTLSLVPTTGFVAMDGANVAGRSFQNSSSITWTNPSGVAGNPSAAVSQVNVNQGGTGVNTLTPYAPLLAGAAPTDPIQQPAIGAVGDVLTSQGSGAPAVFAPLGGLGQLQFASITLTANQVRNLNGTPVSLVSAPGAGKVIVPIVSYGLLNSDSTAFNFSVNSTIAFAYNSLYKAMEFSGNAFVTVTSDVYSWATQSLLSTAGGVPKASVQNQPITLVNTGPNYTGGGSSTITIVFAYIVITI